MRFLLASICTRVGSILKLRIGLHENIKKTCLVYSTYTVPKMPEIKEFGEWESPISSRLATESSVSFQDLCVDNIGTNAVYWSEMRCDEGGRYAVCSIDKNNHPNVTTWTPKEFNARTCVHEYGGGAIMAHNNVLYFSNMADQQIYKQLSADESPTLLTANNKDCRYADAQYSSKHDLIYTVCEDHTSVVTKQAKQPENSVICVDPATGQHHILAAGHDFYSSPRVSPDGSQIAWVQWDHPNMPWDGTVLMVARLAKDGKALDIDSQQQVAGGDDISVMHPRWTADNSLLYVSDKTDWWNIYQVKSSDEHVNIHPYSAEIGGPHWTFGNHYYDVDSSGNVAFVCENKLHIVDLSSGESRSLDTGFENHHHVQFSGPGHIYCVAGSPTKFACVIRVDLQTEKVDIIQKSREVEVDTGYLSVPRKMSWLTKESRTSHGYFYPPQNKDYTAPEGSLPPLLVKVHGGPTSSCSNVLNLKIQYFTSRGFAVLDVDYRGSTGYGKHYRHLLKGQWGITDVEDCSSGALYLAKQKVVDGARLCIDGGSAGGFTTLACLAFTDTFKAGASHYGVSDVSVLAAETHKFESRYLDSMIAPYSEETKYIYDERSPMCHIEKFSSPIAFFQGDEDKVVPPNQAEMMYEALKTKGIPTAYVLFKGEQHGFRKAENIQAALDKEFYFFSQVFGFAPADKHVEMHIDNLATTCNK